MKQLVLWADRHAAGLRNQMNAEPTEDMLNGLIANLKIQNDQTKWQAVSRLDEGRNNPERDQSMMRSKHRSNTVR